MKYFELKDENLNSFRFSILGMGTWQFGGLNFLDGKDCGWQNIDTKELEKSSLFAIENGINHFDTADSYGNGLSEEIIGNFLSKNNLKNEIRVSTKIGFIKNNFENAYCKKNLEIQFEKSLRNLKKGYVDILYFHNSNFGENDCFLDEALEFFYRKKAEGKLLFIGLSCYTTKDFVRLIPKIKPSVIQAKANILNTQFITENSIVAQLLKKYNIKFFAFSPFEHGLLLNKYNSSFDKNKFFCDGDHRKNLKKFDSENIFKLNRSLNEIAEKFNVNSNIEGFLDICLDFLFFYKTVDSVLFGFRNKKQVEIILKYLYKINSIFKEKKDIEFVKNCLK
jgi:myo-inositol catabolism protein IolS